LLERRRVKRTGSFKRQAEQVRLSKRQGHADDHAALLDIMARSGNAFIQMLNETERESLTRGRGPDGAANCRYQTFEEHETVVQQGDEGIELIAAMIELWVSFCFFVPLPSPELVPLLAAQVTACLS